MIVDQNPQKSKRKWFKDTKPSKLTWTKFHPLEGNVQAFSKKKT